MTRWLSLVGTFLALLSASVPLYAESARQGQSGRLVIVGGGLKADNAAVYRSFLDARPENAPTVVIVPTASGEPTSSAEAARDAMIGHGAATDDIVIAKIAIEDDPATRTVDESRWADNIASEIELAKIRKAGAIWFTGGDQSRITRLLLTEAGEDTPYLAAIRARHSSGVVIGGTSAGAAIMSGAMITGGDAIGALLPGEIGEELGLARGLHFLRGVLVDQHFGERARLGRLAVALARLQRVSPIGFGIDEDTALVVHPGQERAKVVGAGYVTILDARSARASLGDSVSIEGLIVGLAANGDGIDLRTGSVEPAWYRKDTRGREYFDRTALSGGGMAVAGTGLADVIGEALMDNSAASEVVRYSFSGDRGVAYRFARQDTSRAAWGRDEADDAAYAISGVRFDIEPVIVSIRSLEKE
ncbi:cyanophycinase [Qipengyuania qiaonensis]|uniref:Cyanophycinase n=1 Tax=Qipengyuania qiaonensis TaxID=2867240 RepID=A0ABS7JCP0_9SPHN|nr:cyanophycinase [Qipengyuania qiaonensis]MBX7483814.1 cyanophycinase [Qipengyuania qiaonensis]